MYIKNTPPPLTMPRTSSNQTKITLTLAKDEVTACQPTVEILENEFQNEAKDVEDMEDVGGRGRRGERGYGDGRGRRITYHINYQRRLQRRIYL